MIFNKDTAEKTAELLLQINAIKLNQEILLLGFRMEIAYYCDNRLILSFQQYEITLETNFLKKYWNNLVKPDVIAGLLLER
jgi:orotate phosphoribosyltransferase